MLSSWCANGRRLHTLRLHCHVGFAIANCEPWLIVGAQTYSGLHTLRPAVLLFVGAQTLTFACPTTGAAPHVGFAIADCEPLFSYLNGAQTLRLHTLLYRFRAHAEPDQVEARQGLFARICIPFQNLIVGADRFDENHRCAATGIAVFEGRVVLGLVQ